MSSCIYAWWSTRKKWEGRENSAVMKTNALSTITLTLLYMSLKNDMKSKILKNVAAGTIHCLSAYFATKKKMEATIDLERGKIWSWFVEGLKVTDDLEFNLLRFAVCHAPDAIFLCRLTQIALLALLCFTEYFPPFLDTFRFTCSLWCWLFFGYNCYNNK